MTQTNILLESGTNELEVVEFYLDEPGYRGFYGVNVAKVLEIIRMQPTTAMPQMRHPSVLGAFPHRGGKIVPLLDLAAYLGKSATHASDSKVIVTEFNNILTGFLVSGVTRIHRLSWSEVEEPGAFLQHMSSNSVTGVLRLEGRVVFLLDMESIVAGIDPSLAIRLDDFEDSIDSEGTVYTVLHADDSGHIRYLVKQLMEETGRFKLIQVTSGDDAWNFMASLKKEAQDKGTPVTDKIQAVISDIEMPRMDGFTLCRKIKEDPDLKRLPVALFSSLVTEALKHKGESVGANAQFAKPDLQQLSEKVLALILDSRRG